MNNSSLPQTNINTTEQSITPVIQDDFYTFLSTAGFVPVLAILLGIRTLIGGIGVFLNLSLVWVTIRNRNLHGPCNILIALESLSLAIYGLGFFPMLVIVLTGQNLMRLEPCFWIMILPVFAKCFASAMMVAIGLDRFKSVLFPWVSSFIEKLFVVLWTTACTVFGLYVAFISYGVMLRIRNNSVMCAASELTQGEAAGFTYTANLVLNYSAPAVYCIFGLFVHLKTPVNIQQQTNRRLFKSIFVLMLIQLLGWGTNALSLFFFGKFFSINTLSELTKWAINCVFSYLLIIAIAANAPALYFCSTEYKKAIQIEFGRFNSTLNNNNTNFQMQQIQTTGKLFRKRSAQQT